MRSSHCKLLPLRQFRWVLGIGPVKSASRQVSDAHLTSNALFRKMAYSMRSLSNRQLKPRRVSLFKDPGHEGNRG